jgi:hypothetical protein
MNVNYWRKLAAIGIVYGRDVIRFDNIEGMRTVPRLEWNGGIYSTAKEIYEAATGTKE